MVARVTPAYVYGLETMAMRGKQEKAQVCRINYGSEKSGQVKNGGAEGGAWCEIEFYEEAGGELVKVGWTCGLNGMEKSKTVD